MALRGRQITAGLVLLLVLMLWYLPAEAQSQEDTPLSFWYGTSFFSQLLQSKQLQTIPVTELQRHPERETVIVVFGNLRLLDSVRQEIGDFRQFFDKGGAVLIATDSRLSQLPEFGSAQIGGQVSQVAPAAGFLQKPDCPLITRFEEGHPLFKGVTQIATIRPSAIAFRPDDVGGLRPLASFPPLVAGQFHGNAIAYILGAGGRGAADGRFLLMAGHGCFLNILILRDEVDNRAFAVNCVNWLTESGNRNYCLFLDEGVARMKLDAPAQSPLPRIDNWNRLLDIMQMANLFNELILQRFPKDVLLHWLALGLSVLILLRVLYLIFAGRYVREVGLPLTSRTLEVTTSNRPLMEQRYDLLTRTANLTEIAGSVVQHWFEERGLAESVTPPRVEATTGGRVSRRWQREIDELWQLARGQSRRPIRPERFWAILLTLDRAKQALRDGRLRLNAT
jgi:hypothetical protein